MNSYLYDKKLDVSSYVALSFMLCGLFHVNFVSVSISVNPFVSVLSRLIICSLDNGQAAGQGG